MDFWILKWISGFHVDFWISKWISGFHVDFRISKWISTFWILFEELLFVILKILLINKPSQPGCTQNTMSQALHSSPRRTAYCVHNVLAHSLSQAPPSFWAGPGHEATLGLSTLFFFCSPLFYSQIPKIIPYYYCNYSFLSETFSYKNNYVHIVYNY